MHHSGNQHTKAKVITIVGARPQFVKLAPLSRRLRERWTEVIIHTGQHYSPAMSDFLFRDLGIPAPDYNLGVGSGSHAAQTAGMLVGIEDILHREVPDMVVVFGDTNSTMAGALAAAKIGIRSVHVEAGLRSFNRRMPEEINRVVADHTCDALFAPTPVAMKNLTREGLENRAELTGDIMVDTLEENLDRARASDGVFGRLGVRRGAYTLLTLHRPYNVDEPEFTPLVLRRLVELGEPVVFPVHPRTRTVLERARIRLHDGVILCDPLPYLEFINVQRHATRVVTDSGGIQKEAYLLGVKCITVRPETEWVETVDAGWNLLADPRTTDFADVVRGFSPSGPRPPLYGRNVADRMVSLIAAQIS